MGQVPLSARPPPQACPPLARASPCTLFQYRQLRSAPASIGRSDGHARSRTRNRGRATSSKKPTWEEEAPGLSLSIRKEAGMPSAFSLSPWAKNSCSRQPTNLRCAARPRVRWPRSAPLSASCSSSTASSGVRGTKSPPSGAAWEAPPGGVTAGALAALSRAAAKAPSMLLSEDVSVPRTSCRKRARRRRSSSRGSAARKSSPGRRSSANAAAAWWFSFTWLSL
mmetsp:Transcript_27996/g.73309  ORF Transcript_27996/g.73309 Transcript_27996/m.73309 type:complete len:224 (-) Transcript_27996:431-1102(-)